MTELNLDDPDLSKKLEDALERPASTPRHISEEEWERMPLWEALRLLQIDLRQTVAPSGWWRRDR